MRGKEERETCFMVVFLSELITTPVMLSLGKGMILSA